MNDIITYRSTQKRHPDGYILEGEFGESGHRWWWRVPGVSHTHLVSIETLVADGYMEIVPQPSVWTVEVTQTNNGEPYLFIQHMKITDPIPYVDVSIKRDGKSVLEVKRGSVLEMDGEGILKLTQWLNEQERKGG